MDHFSIPIQVRWADIDPNRHLRHSAYYDYGSTARIACFSQHGITNQRFEELKIGPILFREEAIFKREIKFEDKINVDMVITRAKSDFSRWSARHHLFKEDHTMAALINLDGAFMDIIKRKLAIPDAIIREAIEDFPRSSDFEWIP